MTEIEPILRDLRVALTAGFSVEDIRLLVRNYLLVPLENITGTNQARSIIVLEVVDWADKRDLVQELVKGAREQNPTNKELIRVAAAFQELQEKQQAEQAKVDQAVESQSEKRFVQRSDQRAKTAADKLFERIVDTSSLLPMSFLEQALIVGQAVGRVHIFRNGQRVGFGTGFLVSPSLMLTNNHIFSNADAAREGKIEFDFQTGADGALRDSQFFHLSPDRFFVTDTALDFTLVAVDATSEEGKPLSEFASIPLLPDTGKILVGEQIAIIQHPEGGQKQIALQGNLIDMFDDFLHYRTSTSGGSAGSPVFNSQWDVIAIHHSRVPNRNEKGELLTVDGELWSPDMGRDRIDWLGKEGIRISSILKRLQLIDLPPEQAKLRDELLAGTHPSA
ncbi:MAG: trypsin-like peptidase domain-containing protein [Anaerolineaceae bacterium]|nr:MAG: trypsin-like peptidase domain-containing protein [Anaerolineaceae bacterium]